MKPEELWKTIKKKINALRLEERLKDFKRRWQKFPYGFKIIGAVILAALVCVIVVLAANSKKNASATSSSSTREITTNAAGEIIEGGEANEAGANESEENLSSQELKTQTEEERKEADITSQIASYGNIGIIKCETHLFMREQPDTTSARIGKLYAGAACSLIAPTEADSWYDTNEWQLIKSGGITGYVKSEYLYTGDEAKEKARENIAERAIVKSDVVNFRSEPDTSSEVKGKVYKGERYLVRGIEGDWIKVEHDGTTGYINSQQVEIEECLNEARRLKNDRDQETALNLYTNLGITNFTSGLKNVRSGPGTEYKIIGMLTPNCAVNILGEDGDWLKIKSGPVEGYVKSDFISTGSDALAKAYDQIQLMAIAEVEGSLNVRSQPNTDSEVVTGIAGGERYPVIGYATNEAGEEWVQLDLGDSGEEDGETMSAFVRGDLVDVRYAVNEAFSYTEDEIMAANSDSRRSAIVEYALKFVGGRYVWGGTSLTKGCDCSGFTQSVLANFGVYIPRVSRDQANAGRKITSAEMRPGDLVFYANSSGTINHVTMYIGGGRIVGAQSTKSGIKTAAWNYRTPVKIVNVLGD